MEFRGLWFNLLRFFYFAAPDNRFFGSLRATGHLDFVGIWGCHPTVDLFSPGFFESIQEDTKPDMVRVNQQSQSVP